MDGGFNEVSDYALTAGGVLYLLARPKTGNKFILVAVNAATGAKIGETETDIEAAVNDADGEAIIEAPTHLAAGGNTLIALFKGSRTMAGFTAPAAQK